MRLYVCVSGQQPLIKRPKYDAHSNALAQVPWRAEEAMLSIGSLERLGFSGAPVQRQSSGKHLSARELGPWPAHIGDDLALQENGAGGTPDGTLAMHAASQQISNIMGGDSVTQGHFQKSRICRTEIYMVAVDARGVEHTLHSWTLFDGKEGVEAQLESGDEAIDEASAIGMRTGGSNDGTPHRSGVVGPGNGVGVGDVMSVERGGSNRLYANGVHLYP